MNGTQTLFDRSSTQDTEYIGIAASGVSTSTEQWQIKEIVYDSEDKKPLSIKYAGGSADYAYAWDDRTTLTYS